MKYTFCLFLTLSSCASYQIKVDSISSKDIPEGRVFVIPATKENRLVTSEFKSYVEQAMRNKGYKIATTAKDSDVVVVFSYDVSSRERLVSRPNYKWVAPQSYNFNSNSSNFGSNQTQTSGTITESGIGHMEQAGSSTATETNYTRSLTISAFESSDLSKPKGTVPTEIWRTEVYSVGTSGDMRRIFPALMAASAPYIGINTRGQLDVDLYQDDQKIKDITEPKEESSREPSGT